MQSGSFAAPARPLPPSDPGASIGAMRGPTRLEQAIRFPTWLRLSEPRRSFGIVLFAIVVAVVFQLATPDTEFARLVGVAIQAVVIILALRAAGAPHRLIAGAAVAMGIVVFAAAILLLGTAEASRAAPRLLTLILILIAPTAVIAGVVRELREDGRVTIQTVYCGICLYLLLGMAFAFLFGLIDDLGSQPFFEHGIPGTPNDFLYFSLATLTTTGYGDFIAGTELGRAMAVTEALIGQTYLVTVLAVIVSNIAPVKRRSRS